MYRLFISAFTMFCLVGLRPASSSDQFLELSAPKTTSLTVIGSVPPKRHIDLDLGGLRTDSARLPEGKRDLEARIRLRNRRELARRKSVAKSPSTGDQKNAKDAPKDLSKEDGQDVAETTGDEDKQVAKVEAPKIKRSYKNKKNRKKSGSGSKKLPPLNANPNKPVSIE